MLVDRFLEDAVEVDVDALRDHTGEVVIGGVMEHIEQAGVHSATRVRDPAADARRRDGRTIEADCARSADALDVRGLLNVSTP